MANIENHSGMVENNVITNTPTTDSKTNKKEPKKETWLDTLKFIIILLAIIIPLRLFIIEPYAVDGHSMDPTLQHGEYMMVDLISYKFSDPKRGDVIIFRYPKDPKVFYVKRIIALPGEKISINNDSVNKETVTITDVNGKKHTLDESYITNKDIRPYTSETTLGADEYFVMGDNRPYSSDSRFWGVLPKKNIVGKPLISLLPLSKFGLNPGKHQFDF